MVVSACFCVSMRDLPDPKEIANTSRKELKFLDIRNSFTKHRPCLTLLKSAMYIHLWFGSRIRGSSSRRKSNPRTQNQTISSTKEHTAFIGIWPLCIWYPDVLFYQPWSWWNTSSFLEACSDFHTETNTKKHPETIKSISDLTQFHKRLKQKKLSWNRINFCWKLWLCACIRQEGHVQH